MKISLEQLQQQRALLREVVARHRSENLRVFGSVLHGNAGDQSDIDFLVDPLPGATLFDLGGLQMELEALMGAPVDLLTPGDLPPSFRDRVLREARPV
jgi:predicted nucleotidyltransferase